MSDNSQFSILIPCWDNLPYLRKCVESIHKHSFYKHQIIVISNEGSIEMLNWLKEQNIEHIHSDINLGICKALNKARSLVKHKYLLYINDDMIVLPDWDIPFVKVIESMPHDRFMLSATLIEPNDTKNPCVIVWDYGKALEELNEELLLRNYKDIDKKDWNGSTWPPNLLPVTLWDRVGGMSEEFSPGMYSDPDLSMKCWQSGVRYFRGLSDSRVYHFGSRSTSRLGKNTGRLIFLNKWKLSANQFYRHFLRMGTDFQGELPEVKNLFLIKALGRFKRIYSRF